MNLTTEQRLQAESDFAALGYVKLSCQQPLAQELKELRTLLHNAMVLEHATIPPYLTLLYTLDPEVDWRISEVVRSVVVEEMLHFVLAANTLNAIGGTIAVNTSEFLPDYPAPLPYGIDDIKVHLYPFSREGILQGMQIEHPKSIRPSVVASHACNEMTIGEFYAYIEARLRAAVEAHGESAIFCGDPARQVPSHVFYYDGGGAIVQVHNLDTAMDALTLITDQGEGAKNSIWTGTESEESGGFREVAHYFRFNELYEERLYREGDTVASGPTGAQLAVPWQKSVKTRPNAKLKDYPEGEVRQAIIDFNRNYCSLLDQMQQALTGDPDQLMPAVVTMCSLRNDFRAITANPFPGERGYHSAPTFEFIHSPAPGRTPIPGNPGSNKETLDRLQQAYSSADLNLALTCMSPNIIWDISGPSDVPYLGVFYGHEGFKRFWTLLGETVQFGSAGVDRMFVDADQAMAYGGEQGTTKSTGAPYHYDWALRYEFDASHKITLMRQYFNPMAIQAALHASPYPTSSSDNRKPQPPQPGDQPVNSNPDLPTIPYPFTLPFYYSSLTNAGVFYLVPLDRVEPFLKGTGLSPAVFDGKALVSFNFQLYTGQFASGIDVPPEKWSSCGAGITQELELNIVSYPSHRASMIAPISYREFIQDGDQTKIYGNHRVWVPADADVAIAAGKTLFGEPKFKTTFKVNLASPNPVRDDTPDYQPQWVETWGFRVDDPNDSNTAIFTCLINTAGLTPIPGNFSPITEYGTHDDKLIGCRWNILQPMNTYFIPADNPSAVELCLGASKHPMRKDMETLLANCSPVAVRTFNSAPAAIQSRAYYP